MWFQHQHGRFSNRVLQHMACLGLYPPEDEGENVLTSFQNWYNNIKNDKHMMDGWTNKQIDVTIDITMDGWRDLSLFLPSISKSSRLGSNVFQSFIILYCSYNPSCHSFWPVLLLTWPSPSLLLSVSSPASAFENGTFACVTRSLVLIINKSMQTQSSLFPFCTTDVHKELLYRSTHDATEIDWHFLKQDGKLGPFDIA